MKKKLLKLLIFTFIIAFCNKVSAQINNSNFITFSNKLKFSPFHKMKKPMYTLYTQFVGGDSNSVIVSVKSIETTAYRFTAPLAGYDIMTNKLVTGFGFGMQKLHYIDSTGKYYCDFSINAMAFAGGNVSSITPNNIISLGIGIGFKNQLIMIVPCYNLPLIKGTKGQFGLVFDIAGTLNN